jgi:hypothetical protein
MGQEGVIPAGIRRVTSVSKARHNILYLSAQ